MRFITITFSFFSFFLLYLFIANTEAELFVHDIIAVKNEEILLKAEIKRRFTPKGGQLVEFFIGEKSIGKALSGGDGFAYKQFSSQRAGMFRIAVKSNFGESMGTLLVLNKGAKIVFTDIESGLLEGEFLKQRPRDGSQDAIRQISRKYPIVVLQTGILGEKASKGWLKKHGYVEMPVIAWNKGIIFKELIQKGMKIKAIVGSDAVIDSAAQYKPLSFSFTGKDSSVAVKNWGEVKKMLFK